MESMFCIIAIVVSQFIVWSLFYYRTVKIAKRNRWPLKFALENITEIDHLNIVESRKEKEEKQKMVAFINEAAHGDGTVYVVPKEESLVDLYSISSLSFVTIMMFIFLSQVAPTPIIILGSLCSFVISVLVGVFLCNKTMVLAYKSANKTNCERQPSIAQKGKEALGVYLEEKRRIEEEKDKKEWAVIQERDRQNEALRQELLYKEKNK